MFGHLDTAMSLNFFGQTKHKNTHTHEAIYLGIMLRKKRMERAVTTSLPVIHLGATEVNAAARANKACRQKIA